MTWYGGLIDVDALSARLEPASGAFERREYTRLLALATGRADALTGRVIGVRDDLEELVRRAEEIRRYGLYALRLRK